MTARYGEFFATRACARGGEFVGHGATPEEALRELHSYCASRSFNAGRAVGEPRIFGRDGTKYARLRHETTSEEDRDLWVASVSSEREKHVRMWDVPAKDGKPGRFFAEVIVARADTKG